MADLPRLMTVDEAAERLGLHPETVRRATRAGKLACYKLQGCIRISVDQLSDYLAANLYPVRESPIIGETDTGRSLPMLQLQQSRRFTRALERLTGS